MTFREWLYYELAGEGIIDDDTDIDPETYDTDDLLNSTDFEMINMDDYVLGYHDYCAGKGIEPVIDLEIE